MTNKYSHLTTVQRGDVRRELAKKNNVRIHHENYSDEWGQTHRYAIDSYYTMIDLDIVMFREIKNIDLKGSKSKTDTRMICDLENRVFFEIKGRYSNKVEDMYCAVIWDRIPDYQSIETREQLTGTISNLCYFAKAFEYVQGIPPKYFIVTGDRLKPGPWKAYEVDIDEKIVATSSIIMTDNYELEEWKRFYEYTGITNIHNKLGKHVDYRLRNFTIRESTDIPFEITHNNNDGMFVQIIMDRKKDQLPLGKTFQQNAYCFVGRVLQAYQYGVSPELYYAIGIIQKKKKDLPYLRKINYTTLSYYKQIKVIYGQNSDLDDCLDAYYKLEYGDKDKLAKKNRKKQGYYHPNSNSLNKFF